MYNVTLPSDHIWIKTTREIDHQNWPRIVPLKTEIIPPQNLDQIYTVPWVTLIKVPLYHALLTKLQFYPTSLFYSVPNDQVVLLNALLDPIPRAIYDYILRSSLLTTFFETLQQRRMLRKMCRPGHAPTFTEVDENPSQMFRKLLSQGMGPAEESKLLVGNDYPVISRSRNYSINQSNFYSTTIPGKARLSVATAKVVFNSKLHEAVA